MRGSVDLLFLINPILTNQQVPTPQAIGTWLRRLSKDNQGIKALRKANKTLLKATLKINPILE
jgi:hypothetical protein